MALTVFADATKTILTSLRSVYKTEAFIRSTKKLTSVDRLVGKISEGIFSSSFRSEKGFYLAETEDRFFTLFFATGRVFPGTQTEENDLVFYKFFSRDKSDRKNDRQIDNFFERNSTFNVIVRKVEDSVPDEEFFKLYLLSENDKVHFPLLSGVQKSIVETENANVLVQGVAGSGKTNVCIEKIVYCACRNYRGKVLYSTFSRGLLIETKNRVSVMKKNMRRFVDDYAQGKVVFLDKNHKKAVENKFGVPFDFDEDEYLIDVLKRVADFLDRKVDYCLIEDLYFEKFGKKEVFSEGDYLSVYLPDAKKRLSGVLEKLKNLSPEIIYKEIYGMIFGKFEPDAPSEMMTREEYLAERADSFTRPECDAIYTVACDYKKYLERENLTDNNRMSRELYQAYPTFLYSLGVLDEVQDFTQATLCMLKKLCLKVFAVGDALQMINPSYFSFGYLKRLLYGDVTGVTELKHNYRNSENIQKIVEKLGEMNVKRFGTHSFVLKGESVKTETPSSAVFLSDKGFLQAVAANHYADVTVIVSTKQKKEELRKLLKQTEILTVSEAKGLERNTVILADILTDDADKWHILHTMTLNRKTADENSVFRYYFNLFYVGVSRAKQYLFVYEEKKPSFFDSFFSDCFEKKDIESALSLLAESAGKVELSDDELCERIEKFCQLEQYENAYFTADRLSDELIREEEIGRIFVSEKFLRHGQYREAGVEFWRRGMDEDAKKMFRVSGDEKLIPLIDACRGEGKNLDVDIVRFLPLVHENEVAKTIITETIKNDYNTLLSIQKSILSDLKGQRSKK